MKGLKPAESAMETWSSVTTPPEWSACFFMVDLVYLDDADCSMTTDPLSRTLVEASLP
jgi:hypothetical protein